MCHHVRKYMLWIPNLPWNKHQAFLRPFWHVFHMSFAHYEIMQQTSCQVKRAIWKSSLWRGKRWPRSLQYSLCLLQSTWHGHVNHKMKLDVLLRYRIWVHISSTRFSPRSDVFEKSVLTCDSTAEIGFFFISGNRWPALQPSQRMRPAKTGMEIQKKVCELRKLGRDEVTKAGATWLKTPQRNPKKECAGTTTRSELGVGLWQQSLLTDVFPDIPFRYTRWFPQLSTFQVVAMVLFTMLSSGDTSDSGRIRWGCCSGTCILPSQK